MENRLKVVRGWGAEQWLLRSHRGNSEEGTVFCIMWVVYIWNYALVKTQRTVCQEGNPKEEGIYMNIQLIQFAVQQKQNIVKQLYSN